MASWDDDDKDDRGGGDASSLQVFTGSDIICVESCILTANITKNHE